MFTNRFFFCLSVLSTMVFSACKKFEKAPIPAYIYVKPFKLVTAANNSQGESSAKIVDAWIDVNGVTIGSYGIPSTVPIMQTGNVKITMKAGIVNSGQDEQRIVYPFYTTDTFNLNLQPERVDTIESTVHYVAGLTFPFIEDFSFSSDKLVIVGKKNQDSMLIMNDQYAWKPNNNYCKLQFSDSTIGSMRLDMNTPNKFGFDIPPARSRVYFEFDYKSNVAFGVGMITYKADQGQLVGNPIIQVSPKETWNKIYLDITNEFIKLTSDYKFKMSIAVNKNEDGSTNFNIDNLKLIYFE